MPRTPNPLACLLQRVLQRRRARRAIVSAVFLFGTLLSLGMFFSDWKRAQREVEDAFRSDAAHYFSTLRHETEEAVIRGATVADFFHTVGSVDRHQFRYFVAPHLKRAPGVVSIVWAPRILARDRDRFEAMGRREWGPGFAIFDTVGRDQPAGRRPEHFPVYYRETLTGLDNVRFLGWDLAATPVRVEALERARDTGQPAMTAKVKLNTGAGGVIVYWPIYEKDATRRSVEERRAHLRGYIAMVFEINRLMEYALGPTPPTDINVSLSDDGAPADLRLLYARSGALQTTPVRWLDRLSVGKKTRSMVRSTMALEVGGRWWSVTCTPTANYFGVHIGPDMWRDLLLGPLITAFIGGYLLLLMRRTDQVEQLVASRTQEVQRAHDRLLAEVVERTRAETVARRLSQQVLSVQEEERRRLSRELHDEAGESLTGLVLSLELLATDVPDEHLSLRQRLHEAATLANETAERVRLLARGLRPPGLDTLGLNASLRGLCHEAQRRTGVPVEYTGTEVMPLADTITICLYRVLQEALTNVAKHAQASRIEVQLQEDAETVALSVTDDGRGFDTGDSPTQDPIEGIGLVGMKERLELLGGRLEIVSRPGQGTCLMAQVPVMGEESLAGALSDTSAASC